MQAWRNLRAFVGMLTFLVPLALWVLVDLGLLWTLAGRALALSLAGFVATQACVNRLGAVIRLLPPAFKDARTVDRDGLPLKSFELFLLRIPPLTHSGRLRRLLKRRRRVLKCIATLFVQWALISFILLVAIYSY